MVVLIVEVDLGEEIQQRFLHAVHVPDDDESVWLPVLAGLGEVVGWEVHQVYHVGEGGLRIDSIFVAGGLARLVIHGGLDVGGAEAGAGPQVQCIWNPGAR